MYRKRNFGYRTFNTQYTEKLAGKRGFSSFSDTVRTDLTVQQLQQISRSHQGKSAKLVTKVQRWEGDVCNLEGIELKRVSKPGIIVPLLSVLSVSDNTLHLHPCVHVHYT